MNFDTVGEVQTTRCQRPKAFASGRFLWSTTIHGNATQRHTHFEGDRN